MRVDHVTVAMILLASSVAPAEKVRFEGSPHDLVTDCVTNGYESYPPADGGWIVPCDPVGVRFGPLAIEPDPDRITDVVVEVEMQHTWVGDLRMTLQYDLDCDGISEKDALFMCRIALDGCDPEGCCGCSGDLGGTYRFTDDAAVASLEEIDCRAPIPPGCYRQDDDAAAEGLQTLEGEPTSGCFWLYVQDGGCGDSGTIFSWTVHLENEPASTPMEEASWGAIKARY